jgi:predicted acylesterase/phospholipase RssA
MGFVPTMKQLYTLTQCTLVCVTMNIDKDEVEYISHETEPSLSCVDAALMSMNIPLLFYKIKYHNSIYIDGAFGNPYPVDYYDDGKTNILGIYIKSKSPDNVKSVDDNNLWYIYKILFSSMNQNRELLLKRSSDKCKHIELSTSVVDMTGFTLDHKTKADMISIGYRRGLEFLREIKGLPESENLDSEENILTLTTEEDSNNSTDSEDE